MLVPALYKFKIKSDLYYRIIAEFSNVILIYKADNFIELITTCLLYSQKGDY